MNKLGVAATAFTLAISMGTPAIGAQSSELSAEAQQIIQHFNMQHIPHEGPWFVQSAKSNEVIEGPIASRYESPRYAYTAILSLMTDEDFSALHRLNTDEIWHFYGGSPAEMLMLFPDGHDEIRILGNDIAAGQEPQILVPRGVWMGAKLIDNAAADYTFFGSSMAPGFEYQDYEAGIRTTLLKAYPQQAKRIIALTRPDEDNHLTQANPMANSAPPINIEEIIGLNGPVINADTSVAKVTMQAGEQLPLSYNKANTEVVIVVSGSGELTVAEQTHNLEPNAVVLLPPKVKYRFKAHSDLVFYAVVTPAFVPDDHVELPE
ncbi:cupin domain-containing protein [Alteromonas sp. C1M14]|uniref:cupin domain-containing protein n=1 Tax=Alteromonas sp. C1M14 TaxID=2841567 RepID=UPI001C0A16D4|nr:cupin domain-containing protein [Alteromonas sp. C1M14]MBU2978813.1 cupin domain-containing protein [Alteromonas sp. C1M14]